MKEFEIVYMIEEDEFTTTVEAVSIPAAYRAARRNLVKNVLGFEILQVTEVGLYDRCIGAGAEF